MIDAMNKRYHALKVARRWFPRRRRGKKPSLQTLYRWSNEGYHGVILETVQVGSTRCTTKEACVRFIEQVTALARRPESLPASCRPKNDGQIDKALEKAGFDRPQSRPRSSSSRE